MGVFLVAAVVGIPCAVFLIYCLTPKGKNWLRTNQLI